MLINAAGPHWQPLRGEWSIDDGELVPGEGPGHLITVRPGPELGRRFEIEAELAISSPGGSGGIAFNIGDRGDGIQRGYVVSIGAGAGSGWVLFELTDWAAMIVPASGPLDLESGRPYTLRVAAADYGHFKIVIIDGDQVRLSEDVRINPFRQQLAGGSVGAYCGRGGSPVRFRSLRYRTSTERSEPPTYRPQPLVCTPPAGHDRRPVQGHQPQVADSSTVDQTQAQVGITQTLLTAGDIQYVAYYAADGQLTVAQRRLGGDDWIRQPLDSTLVIDNHNDVTCALDRAGQLHVAGNMHAAPLIYYRSNTPGDVRSLTRIPTMTDPARERSSTYPRFLHNAEGALVYNYRSGSSGNGSTYYSIYDEEAQTWQPMLDTPLFDGERIGNAYPSDPVLGPDGCFHLAWVWRGTGDAATNHDLCHARSRDLVHWETAAGEPLELPLTQKTRTVIIDPVPIFGGLLNIGYALGFDAQGLPVISYYKLDDHSNTQIYVARPVLGSTARRAPRWQIVTVSRWSGRYIPERVGYIDPPPQVSSVSPLPDGSLRLDYRYRPSPDRTYAGTWILDHDSLLPTAEIPIMEDLPAGLDTPRSDFPGMAVQLRDDTGRAGPAGQRYVLRYEAMPVPVSSAPRPEAGPLDVHLITP